MGMSHNMSKRKVELIGGIILILIGMKIVIEHSIKNI